MAVKKPFLRKGNMDKMLSYAKLQKNQKKKNWTTGLKIWKLWILFFLIKWFSICNFECLQPNHEIVSTLFYRYKTRWRLFQGLGLHFSQWFLVCCQKWWNYEAAFQCCISICFNESLHLFSIFSADIKEMRGGLRLLHSIVISPQKGISCLRLFNMWPVVC